MEDRWIVCADGPDKDGNCVVRMHRSWTSYRIVEFKLKVAIDGGSGGGKYGDAEVTEITWETDKSKHADPSEEYAKEIAQKFCEYTMKVWIRVA